MLGLHLAPDAKYWSRLWSVRFLIVGAAFSGIASGLFVFGYLPIGQAHPFAFLVINAVVNILALTSRLVDQKDVPCT
jgi:hypothetical protein